MTSHLSGARLAPWWRRSKFSDVDVVIRVSPAQRVPAVRRVRRGEAAPGEGAREHKRLPAHAGAPARLRTAAREGRKSAVLLLLSTPGHLTRTRHLAAAVILAKESPRFEAALGGNGDAPPSKLAGTDTECIDTEPLQLYLDVGSEKEAELVEALLQQVRGGRGAAVAGAGTLVAGVMSRSAQQQADIHRTLRLPAALHPAPARGGQSDGVD
jgi:hypothetical protein